MRQAESSGIAEQGLVSESEIEAVLRPFVREPLSGDDPRWRAIVARTTAEQARRRRRRRLIGWLPRFRRTQWGIERSYSQQWANTSFEQQLGATDPIPLEWRGDGFLASAANEKRIQHLFLIKVIERLCPASVLEVGCGNGLHLLLLAGRFPHVAFSGVELTRSGVEAARRASELEELPPILRHFAIEPPVDPRAHCRIEVRQASARALPFDDRSFDLVFTVLALEQMEELRHHALTELRRVAGRHAFFIEPFRDWNQTGARRDYIVANDYFAAWVSDLEHYGLRPIATADMPCKIVRGVGAVLAEVI